MIRDTSKTNASRNFIINNQNQNQGHEFISHFPVKKKKKLMFEFSDQKKEIRFLKDVCDKDLAEMSYIRDTQYKNYRMVDKNGVSLENPKVYPNNPT